MGGPLLDETTVFGSEVEDGNRHYHYNLPVVMAGRAGGLETGRYVDLRGSKTIMSPLPTSSCAFSRMLDAASKPSVMTAPSIGHLSDDSQLASTPKPHIHRLPTPFAWQGLVPLIHSFRGQNSALPGYENRYSK